MQIVIDIEDLVYHQIKQHGEVSEFHKLIIHGTPLPKGHGRIIDETKINKCEQGGLIIKDGNITHCLVTDAPTIIKADEG